MPAPNESVIITQPPAAGYDSRENRTRDFRTSLMVCGPGSRGARRGRTAWGTAAWYMSDPVSRARFAQDAEIENGSVHKGCVSRGSCRSSPQAHRCHAFGWPVSPAGGCIAGFRSARTKYHPSRIRARPHTLFSSFSLWTNSRIRAKRAFRQRCSVIAPVHRDGAPRQSSGRLPLSGRLSDCRNGKPARAPPENTRCSTSLFGMVQHSPRFGCDPIRGPCPWGCDVRSPNSVGRRGDSVPPKQALAGSHETAQQAVSSPYSRIAFAVRPAANSRNAAAAWANGNR